MLVDSWHRSSAKKRVEILTCFKMLQEMCHVEKHVPMVNRWFASCPQQIQYVGPDISYIFTLHNFIILSDLRLGLGSLDMS